MTQRTISWSSKELLYELVTLYLFYVGLTTVHSSSSPPQCCCIFREGLHALRSPGCHVDNLTRLRHAILYEIQNRHEYELIIRLV